MVLFQEGRTCLLSNFDRFPFWTGFRAPINKEGHRNGQKINKLESNKMFLNYLCFAFSSQAVEGRQRTWRQRWARQWDTLATSHCRPRPRTVTPTVIVRRRRCSPWIPLLSLLALDHSDPFFTPPCLSLKTAFLQAIPPTPTITTLL